MHSRRHSGECIHVVIPANAGIQSIKEPLRGTLFYWIPACAGKTAGACAGKTAGACAGMTAGACAGMTAGACAGMTITRILKYAFALE